MRVVAWRLGTRPSETRIPFRYGKACLTNCPQALLELTLEKDGAIVRGYASDCLPPLWFDKAADRGFDEQIQDMLDCISLASKHLVELRTFPSLGEAVKMLWNAPGLPGRPKLLASFGQSMVERCLIDAICRHAGRPFAELLAAGELYGDFATVLDAWGRLKTISPWQLNHTQETIAVRHTVGLADPLSKAETQSDRGVGDGLPETMEDHLRHNGIRYLKVKIGNRGREDVERLLAISRVIQLTGVEHVNITLDGNEQYTSMDEFSEFWKEICSISDLNGLTQNVIAVEQPLNRLVALRDSATQGLRKFSRQVPVIIDESDANKDDCWRALCLGYSGASSKACKGITKALINRQLIQEMQQENRDGRPYLMTGEDLCCVGVVSLQTDLALVSTMGLEHVERNGHHYHAGLGYLSKDTYADIIQAHGDLYELKGGIPVLKIQQGNLNLRSVNKHGFGFKVDPHFETYEVVRQGD